MRVLDPTLQDLQRQHPEWRPWLAVVQEILSEIAHPKWNAMVPLAAVPQASKTPLLAETTVALDRRALGRAIDNVMRVASRGGTPQMATLQRVLSVELDVLSLFRAALNQDDRRITAIASVAGADLGAFSAIAALLPGPFLHACNRRWASAKSASWMEGYCPICGAWPAFTEVRGIERTRYFRCAGCGSEWQAQYLFCPYCGTTDHKQLISLAPEQDGPKSVIDACNWCLGYVKAFTTLQGSPPGKIMLTDLASVELDLAAAERGYKRPQGAGYSLNVTVVHNGA